MASRPGLLTEWPWQRLGNFKYVVVAPWVAHSFYLLATKDMKDMNLNYILIFPSLLLRMLHNQIWISISRLQTARSPHRILDRSIDFEQVDRERNWDDQILFNGILFYVGYHMIPGAPQISMWQINGVIINILLHAGPVEFLYYWFHRALHHHFLYSRYHSHHHASIVTEPITSVIHPFAEHIVYFMLFAIPMLVTIFTGTASMVQFVGYIFYIDFMNNLGHCNFELVPKWLFSTFPPLKYLMYTPSFHSLHHTQFRTNYSLFMPFYDYLYNTMDKSSDKVYETSLKGKKEMIDVVHLTHPTTLQSIYHLRLGIASLASKPHKSNWYDLVMWPLAWVSMVFTWFYSSSFVVERNKLKNIKIQTWVIPRYKFQYGLSWEKEAINDLIEKAILEADTNGVKVLSLGLLNQAKELNESGDLYIQKYPKLKLRIVDGSSLAAAVIINSIPKGTQQILLKGNISKVGRTVIQGLCNKGVKVVMTNKHDYYMLEPFMLETMGDNLLLSNNCMPQVWLVGDGLDDAEQWKAEKGTTFIPFSHFPPKKVRKDCLYHSTAAMKIPNELQNMHACENWLPRMVMSAWRIAGIIHALEEWDEHECGDTILQVDKIWMATLRHGFLPLLNE
ncbi:hypothetical protein M5K25_016217 [Dendrobium thyrsiflorum]|uniref:aldehyde oxygenase (deformylating) n=1 Tax=Dendrobium thyrsiflorum TaxID=117978 RepID=A0ABD0UIY2_DENTH